jgi:hypothetical protein
LKAILCDELGVVKQQMLRDVTTKRVPVVLISTKSANFSIIPWKLNPSFLGRTE